jgi:hypothetical protein
MSERLVTVLLGAICLGQVWAARRGKWHGAVYYVCVSLLGYFSVWRWCTWSTDRLCAAILVAAWLARGSSAVLDRRAGIHPYLAFASWGVAVTLVAGFFLPEYGAVFSSSAYREWRLWIQLANWVLLAGAGWVIAKTFAHPGAFLRARAVITTVATILCAYALYQAWAYSTGLPTTGIRRPVEGVTAEGTGEQFAAYTLQGQVIFRPGSLIGEPKGLGAACVFWLALVLSNGLNGRLGWRAAAILGLLLLTLWLTGSTSAWAGAMLVLIFGLWLIGRRGAHNLGVVFGTLALLALGAAAWLRVRGMSWQEITFQIVLPVQARFVDRLAEQGPLGETPEQLALDILKSNPSLALFGTGYGGISAHIAAALGGTSQFVLFPNNGLLGMVSNFGFVGLLMMLWSLRRGLRLAWRAKPGQAGEAGAMAFVGSAALLQCLIFSQTWLLSWAFGFLLAAELRARWVSPVSLWVSSSPKGYNFCSIAGTRVSGGR